MLCFQQSPAVPTYLINISSPSSQTCPLRPCLDCFMQNALVRNKKYTKALKINN